jgi:translation initiation factor IF-1
MYHYCERRVLQSDGIVIAKLAASNFRVELVEGPIVLCRPNWTITRHRVSIYPGDKVLVELPIHTGQMDRGRIVYCYNEVMN